MPENYWWIWMIFAAFFIVGEIFTAAFFLLPFGIGAVLAGLLARAGLGLAGQLTVFIVTSVILVAASRRLAERFSRRQPPGVGADRFSGEPGVVLEAIDNAHNTGRVRLGREEWRAESETGAVIPAGAAVVVVRVSGAHVVVAPREGGE